jgi:hypothetical protein
MASNSQKHSLIQQMTVSEVLTTELMMALQLFVAVYWRFANMPSALAICPVLYDNNADHAFDS